MEFGVCIIALGYELYGTCALNLAISLKIHEPNLNIALLCESKAIKHLSKDEINLFDYLISVPECEFENKNYFRVKLLVNKYTPFQKTIYLDADNLFFDKKISTLFEEVSKTNFCIGYNGYYECISGLKTTNNYSFWTENESQCCSYHEIEVLHQTLSGFFYFEQDDWNNTMFKLALDAYDDPSSPCIGWGAGRPDEYGFNVALGKMDYMQDKFNPLYFDKLHGFKAPYEIYNEYYGMAMGGHRVAKNTSELHDKLVNKYSEIKLLTPRLHVNKADVIPERNKN